VLTAAPLADGLVGDADPEQLAHTLMAAFQGGMLLTQAARDITPLRNALLGAIAHVESYASRRRSPAPSLLSPGPGSGHSPGLSGGRHAGADRDARAGADRMTARAELGSP
jgi:hypothetical protein